MTLLHHHRVHDPYDTHESVELVHASAANRELCAQLADLRVENRQLCLEVMRLRNMVWHLEQDGKQQ